MRGELLEAQRKVQCYEMRNECVAKNVPSVQPENPPCQPPQQQQQQQQQQQRPFSAFKCRTTDSPFLRAQLRDHHEEINRLKCMVHNQNQQLEEACRIEQQREQARFVERTPGNDR